MSDPPPAEGQAGKYSVDASGAQGVQVGDHNRQVNYVTHVVADEVTRPGRVTVHGEIESPYLGLKAFGEDDAAFFFGREKATDDILQRLRRRLDVSQPLVVSGVSGAGKSSLLQAGVLPRMSEAGLAPAPGAPPWPRLVLTPARAPLAELAAHVAPLAGVDAAAMRRSVQADPAGFAITARTATSMNPNDPGRLLLVIDQFEQVFTQCDDETERSAFIAALHAAATARQGTGQVPSVLVVLVVRADFEARCAEYEELTDAVQDRYLLAPMTQRQLRLAITRPAEMAAASVEPDLVEELVRAVGGSSAAGVLSHLSHALDQAWRSRAEDDVLSLADYERVGGVEGSIAASANSAFGRLTTVQQALAQPVFMRLVTTSSDLIVSAGRATRAELTSGAPAANVDAVIEAFAAERLLTVGRDYVEISHEVLLTAWDKLQSWLDGDKIDMARYSRLNADARDWDTNERPASYLYPPGRLDEVDDTTGRWSTIPGRYPSLGPIPQAFLAAARRAARRNRRIRRGVIAILSALTVAAATTAILAGHYAATANQQRTDALHVGAVALSRALASQALSLAGSDSMAAQQLAAAAWYESKSSQAASAMTTVLTQQLREGELPAGLSGPGSGLFIVAVSPDGRLIAAGDKVGGYARLWDAATGKPVGRLIQAGSSPYSAMFGLAFSPDGKLLASATAGEVQLWNPMTGTLVRTLLLPDASRADLYAVAFSPDGDLVASGGDDGDIHQWNTATGKPAKPPIPIGGVNATVFDLAFSPDGTFLASADSDGYIRLWNPSTAAPVSTPMKEVGVVAIDFSPSGRLLASADGDGTVRLWNPATGQAVGAPMQAASAGVTGVAFSPGGRLLASADGDGYVKLWDPATGREVGSPLAAYPDGSVDGVAFSKATGLLASADSNGTVQLWDAAAGLPVGSTLKTPANQRNVSFSSTASLLMARAEGYIAQWPQAGSPGRASAATADNRWATNPAAAVSGNGTMVVVPASGGADLITGTLTGARTRFLPAAPGTLNSLATAVFSPDGKLLATADDNSGYVKLWNTATGTQAGAPLPVNAGSILVGVTAIAFSPDGTTLAAAGLNGYVTLWNTATHSRARASIPADTADSDPGVNALAFSPDGKVVASGDSDGKVQLWAVPSGRLAATFSPIPALPEPEASAVAFSPDGTLLATGYQDGTIQLWNPVTRQPIGSLPPSTSVSEKAAVNGLRFTPDSNLLLSTDGNLDVDPWPMWIFAHPYDAICDDVGPPSAATWKQYESGTPEPAGICAGVLPASRLGG